MRRLASQGEAFANADTAFHETLLAPLPNGLLRQLAQAFWEIHTVAVPLLGIAPAERIIDTINAHQAMLNALEAGDAEAYRQDRKSTRLNSSHVAISYAVFCLKKKKGVAASAMTATHRAA